jgi:hypothetical protein
MATDIDFPESIPAPTGQAVESPRQVERRHPAQDTADRIAQTVDDYADQLTPRELDAITRAQRAFGSIARGER